MATAGTLISDLGDKSPVIGDDDLVNKILNEINSHSSTNPVMNSNNPPAPSGRVINSPNPNSTFQSIDPGTATAHMIGKDYPTPADFANLMHPSGSSTQYSGAQYINQNPNIPYMQPTLMNAPIKGNLYSDILAQIKQPLLVSIIVFIVSLPVINVLIGHYLPSLLRIGGDLTTAGLLVKSAVAGFLFWFIQRVLVPLMIV